MQRGSKHIKTQATASFSIQNIEGKKAILFIRYEVVKI